MNISFFYNKFTISIGIIAIPFLSFFSNNLHDLDFVILKTLLITFILTLASVFSFSKLLEFFNKKINYKIYAFFISFIFFLFFYIYTFLRDLLYNFIPTYHGNLAFLFIIIIFIIFFIFCYIKKNKFITNLILIYLLLSFILTLSITLIGFTKNFFEGSIIYKNLYKEKEIGKSIINSPKNNMYFVVVDGAVSIKKFDKFYNTNYISSYLPNFKKLGFNYIHNTRSAYNDTKTSLGSLFYMKYHIDFTNYKKYSLNYAYPVILQKYKAANLPLIKKLKILGYNFKWIGNAYHNCELYNPNFCIESQNISFKNQLISFYVVNSFLQRSPIIPLYHRVNNFFSKNEIKEGFNYEFKKNDSIYNFINKTKNIKLDKNNFFFIHANLPHRPYIYESDCSKNKNRNENENTGYKKNYECMLNRLEIFLEYINKHDPSANVIITSDHGQFLVDKKENGKKEMIAHHYNTFTLIKISKECKSYLNNKLNIPNEIRLLLACNSNQKVELLDPKSYYVDYRKDNLYFGTKYTLDEIKSKKNEDFDAEFLLKAEDEFNSYITALEKTGIKPTDYNINK